MRNITQKIKINAQTFSIVYISMAKKIAIGGKSEKIDPEKIDDIKSKILKKKNTSDIPSNINLCTERLLTRINRRAD